MVVEIDPTLKDRFPGLQVVVKYVDGVKVENNGADLQKFKDEISGEVRRKHSLGP
jgi:hypothetical protein